MAGSFEVGSIIARIGIDDSPFVKQGRALLTKAKKLGKDLGAALQGSGLGAAAGAAAGAASGAAGAAVSAGVGAGVGAAVGAGVAGTGRELSVIPSFFEDLEAGGGTELVRRAEALGVRIRDALRRGFFGGGLGGVLSANTPLIEGGGNALVQRFRTLGEEIGGGIRDADFTVISSSTPVRAIDEIRKAARGLANFLRGPLKLAFFVGFKIPLKTTLLAFRAIRGSAKLTAKAVRGIGGGIGSVFRGLKRTLFGLPALITAVVGGLGGAALVTRAKEVESLRIAFENLTGAVGENAQSFIVDLRKATRGAVSDIDLFRVTNNAALLGVVQSQEEYIKLATAARRLGRAAGRTTVDAINDLSIGIGRQSRLILDNLGIVVRVDEANQKYANSLGKTVSQLTVVDKQQAFLNATLEAADDKVVALGPDVETLNDAFGRFTAQLSNTATFVAEAFVGPGPFSAIADFLETNAARIQAFAKLVASVVQTLFRTVGNLIQNVFSGGSTRDLGRRISQVLNGLARFTFRVISLLLSNIFGELGFLILKLFTGLLASVGNAIIVEIGSFFLKMGAEIDKFLVRTAAKIPGLSSLLGLDDPEEVRRIEEELDASAAGLTSRLEAFGKENQRVIDEFVAESTEQVVNRSIEAVEEAKESLSDLAETSKDEGSVVGAEMVKAFDEISAAAEQFDKDVESNTIKPLRDLSAQSRKAQKALNAIGDEFDKLLAPFTKRLQTLRIEVDTEGLSDSAVELAKFDAAFDGIKSSLEATDLAKIDALREKLAALLAERDAGELALETVERIKALDEALVALTDSADQLSVGELAIQFRNLGRELEEALKESSADMAGEITEKFKAMDRALAEVEVARVNSELAQLEVQLKNVEASGAELRIRELEAGFNLFAAALRKSGLEATEVTAILGRMRTAVSALQKKEAFADLTRTAVGLRKSLADAQFELEQIGRTDAEQTIAEINKQFAEQVKIAGAAAKALKKLRIENGAGDDEILAVDQSLQKQIRTLEELRIGLVKTAQATEIKAQADAQASIIASSIEKNVGGAIVAALAKGESVGKQWANILGGFLSDALERAIKDLTGLLQGALSKLFEGIGGGAGAGALASGLLGIGAAILQNLDSKSQSTVEDFDEAINSSEAVRGVVAGPTNVAISKIGDSLKQAMRTTEILLSEILGTLQTGGAGGGATLESNAALPLSTSSTS